MCDGSVVALVALAKLAHTAIDNEQTALLLRPSLIGHLFDLTGVVAGYLLLSASTAPLLICGSDIRGSGTQVVDNTINLMIPRVLNNLRWEQSRSLRPSWSYPSGRPR